MSRERVLPEDFTNRVCKAQGDDALPGIFTGRFADRMQACLQCVHCSAGFLWRLAEPIMRPVKQCASRYLRDIELERNQRMGRLERRLAGFEIKRAPLGATKNCWI